MAGGAWLSDNVFAIAGIADANANPTKPFDGFDTFFNQREYFTNVDLGWTSSRDRAYFDNIHVTYWHADERVEAGVPSGWGVAGSFSLFPGDKWMPFVRAGYSKDGGSLLQKSLSAGFAFQPNPEFDLFGFGFNWGEPNESTFQPDLRDQYSMEAFYRFQLADHLAVTPDIQFLIHPALETEVDSICLMGGMFLMMQERTSVSDSMMPSRNVGIVLNGTIPSERVSWAAGVFNDWFDAGEKLDEGATQVVGRITALPYVSEGGGSLLHLGLGMRHTNAKQGLQYRTEPEFNLAPDFVDTKLFEANSAMTYDFEVSAARGAFWLSSELVRTQVRSPSVGDPTFGGYHVTAAWTLTGEARSYNRRGGGTKPLPHQVGQSRWMGCLGGRGTMVASRLDRRGRRGRRDGRPHARSQLVADAGFLGQR